MTEFLTSFHGTVARRFAVVLVALVLGWFGMGNAHAAVPGCPDVLPQYRDSQCPTRAGAFASLQEAIDVNYYSGDGYPNPVIKVGTNLYYADVRTGFGTYTYIRRWLSECPEGMSWDENTKTCACPTGQIKNDITGKCMQSCSTRPTPAFTPIAGIKTIPNGSVGCDRGCLYVSNSNGDGTFSQTFLGDAASHHCSVTPGNCEDNGPGYTMNYALNMCVPPQIECSENQVKDPHSGQCTDGCPLGKVMDANGQCKIKDNTCPAGQVKGPDGSCVQDSCPAGQTKGNDGTCKKGNDNDKDEGDDDKYFSGGDSCNAPPACSGDAIMCGQARIQWRIDCNTRRNVNISGGSCAAIPVCTGEKCNAMEYAQLLQQWRSACALEKIAKGEGGDGEGNCGQGTSDVDCNGVPDVLEGSIAEAEKGTPGVDEEGDTLWSQVDQGGWLAGGSCPGLPTISIAGMSMTQLSTTVCEQGAVLANLIFLYGLVAAAGIIGRGAAGV